MHDLTAVHMRTSHSSVHLTEQATEAEAKALGSLTLAAIRDGVDLSLLSSRHEPDDVGANFRVPIAADLMVVCKRIKKDRVDTPTHELHLAAKLSALGFRTLRYIGLVEFEAESWLVSQWEPTHLNLGDVLTGQSAPSPSEGRKSMLLYELGRLARRLLHHGVLHEDFDPKNLLIHESFTGPYLMHDFERTPQRLRDPNEILSVMRSAVVRRIQRYELSDNDLEHILRGFLSLPLSIAGAALAASIQEHSQQRHTRTIVAIDGLAGSGKTTLASRLAYALGEQSLETDYFVRFDRQTRSQRDFDAPHCEWYDLGRLTAAVRSLKDDGYASITPGYDHATGQLEPRIDVAASRVVICEGMYSIGALSDLALRVYMSCSDEEASRRFVQRDASRGVLDANQTAQRQLQINSPATKEYMANARRQADVVLQADSADNYRLLWAKASLAGSLITRATYEVEVIELDTCPFCGGDPPAGRFHTTGDFQALYNVAPIVDGHVLIAPLRHVHSLSDLDTGERANFFSFAYDVTQLVLNKTGLTDFDWALQNGVAAGQSVGHLHLHVLPRNLDDADRVGAWFTSIFGPTVAAPESDHRARLSDDELRSKVTWLAP